MPLRHSASRDTRWSWPLLVLPTIVALAAPGTWASGADGVDRLRSLLAEYCYQCHSKTRAEHELDFESMSDAALLADSELLDLTLWMVEERAMPPAEADAMRDTDREAVTGVLDQALTKLRDAAPDDPGVVVSPRINHSEYNYIARALPGRLGCRRR